MAEKFNYLQIQGVRGNLFVSDKFIEEVEKLSGRIDTKPEYVLAAMSFETGGSFNPAIRNPSGATGLIQFMPDTARAFGTTTEKLKAMTPLEQLKFVEAYLGQFKGRLKSLEAVYTSILSGSPKAPDDVLFVAGTPEYNQNPLDWNRNGQITAREATTPVAARLFGGIELIQQKLMDLGIVPDALKTGFVDRRWGKNTSTVLAVFQKLKGLAETGAMDEATGEALFQGLIPSEAIVLKRGDKNDDVKKLQESLIKLGCITQEEVDTGFGTFGERTEKAVKRLQGRLEFPETGIFGDLEQTAVDKIEAGVSQGSAFTQFVKILQKRLVAINYMTQAQVATGFGTFGRQTDTAVRKFQKDNLLPETGVIEVVTFRVLFTGNDTGTAPANELFAPEDTEHYTVKKNAEVFFTKQIAEKVAAVAKIYFEKTGSKFVVTSGFRPPMLQAPAMYNKIVREGEPAVGKLYWRSGTMIVEILDAYGKNKGDRQKAIAAMEAVIEQQVRQQRFISNHLRSNAVDVRKTARFKALDEATRKVGGRVVRESDHFHLELT